MIVSRPDAARPEVTTAPDVALTAALLWEACRRDVDVDAVTRAATCGQLDVALLTSAAVDQGVAGLLWRAVVEAGCDNAIGEAGDWLAAAASIHRLEAVVLLPGAVSAAMTPLSDAGLEPVVFKGPAVAARYPAPGLRTMEDIDVLLPRRFHRHALRSLQSAGWEVVRASALDRYDSVLRHPDVPSLALELHYGLESWYERTTRLDPERLWSRRIPIDCLGTPTYGLRLEDEIAVLAAHAGKPFHCFRRMVWVADLAMVTENARSVDWDAVAGVAARGRCRTVVAVALALARRVGVESPEELFPLPETGWRRGALDAVIDPGWPLVRDRLPTFHLRYALADTSWRRACLVAGTLHETPSWPRRLAFPLRVVGQAGRRWRALRAPTRSGRADSTGDGMSRGAGHAPLTSAASTGIPDGQGS